MTKRLTIGILAHVDAGKTTLSEALLYKSGVVRNLGRVDHGDTFFDTHEQERARGITIFSKEATLSRDDVEITLLDTPGHVDFSAEMERTLHVLDYAILLISGTEGVQGHTVTLWNLLKSYHIPVFVFANKMDLEGAYKEEIMASLRRAFGDGFIDFTQTLDGSDFDYEEIAMCDEDLLAKFLEKGEIDTVSMVKSISLRKLFPCYFGSALKLEYIDKFIDGLCRLTREGQRDSRFGARVYKITRDSQGTRLTHIKLTGGSLQVKDVVRDEKIDQIRVYSGEKYISLGEAEAGMVCALTGLSETKAGQGLGFEESIKTSMVRPVMTYGVLLPKGQDEHSAFVKLKELEEEDPQLHIVWNEESRTIEVRLMGEMQMETLQREIEQRFGMKVEFGQGKIAYRETIARSVKGAGHFEPLRHYAEVHLLLEPGAPGSGIAVDSKCSEDFLDRNWQRLIQTHLAEKEHIGVLTGSPITDMKITLLAGRSHLKHTEGGDFRQATYRALRQGLRKAESILLEPWYEFRLQVPEKMIGRAMSDVQRMGGSFQPPLSKGENAVLTGKAPVYEMKDYGIQVTSYTKGYGSLTCSLRGYEPCHNSQQVIASIGYDPDRDLDNTADSIFCSNGAGCNVSWDEVDKQVHIQMDDRPERQAEQEKQGKKDTRLEEAELERIFEMTYGKPKQRRFIAPKTIEAEPVTAPQKTKPMEVLPEYLLVDGYNIIFAWDELKALARDNLDAAREALIEIMENYRGYRKCNLILVFDAYKVKGGERHYEKRGDVDVVYTKEAETADTYIERTTYKLGKKYSVRVATSDRLEQMIIMGSGGMRISAGEFKAEVNDVNEKIAALIEAVKRKQGI
ncbi:MAG: GTP-binding protein [Clostridiales bacterium]|nr:GTP-binding protein [Clostridiales bacterium]